MNIFKINVDNNGFAIFDPALVGETYGENIKDVNLLREFVETDAGDFVVENGTILPIINIPTGTYNVVIKSTDESCEYERLVWKEIGTFPLSVHFHAVCSDLGVFISWSSAAKSEGFILDIQPGFYSATVKLYGRDPERQDPHCPGYIVDLKPETALPSLTADLDEALIL